MPKPRTKRGAKSEERKRKRQGEEDEANDAGFAFAIDTKRPRRSKEERQAHDDGGDGVGDRQSYQDEEAAENNGVAGGAAGETEFFGMLAEEEQEYFRRADEMLELNDFPSADDRNVFLESVFREAQGKELKLASSQSCSRLMERLIQLSTTAQKKHLFEAFAGHFLSLVQHRFASHCCEALFLRSAGAVTQELGGSHTATKRDVEGTEDQPQETMENMFLTTLDELEGSLAFLITDRFASHTLRVLLLVLSGRPLEDIAARTLMKSKKKENISVAGSAAADEQNLGSRSVPESFQAAIVKIIDDSTAGMDATALRVLAKHPIGNPTLQLLLELDLTLSKGARDADSTQQPLVLQLLPGAPKSLADESSSASEFVNGMVYDPIGARLIETLITHCPGKIFKALNHGIFLPRIQGYVRNDVSSYAAIRVLNRLGKDDLVEAVGKIAPTVPQLVAKSRFNVLKALFERCAARGANDEIKQLMKGLKEGCGKRPEDLTVTLCSLTDENDEEEEKKSKKRKKDAAQLSRNEYAIQSHGAQLLTALLAIPGPSKGVHESLLALSDQQLVRLANTSMPTVSLLTTALKTPSVNSLFQKQLVSKLSPHIPDLAVTQFGHNLVNAVAEIPAKGKDFSVPFHIKEGIMAGLQAQEGVMRDTWMGRSAWRTWKGDMYKTRRGDWKVWMKEMAAPQPPTTHQTNGHGERDKRQRGRGQNRDET